MTLLDLRSEARAVDLRLPARLDLDPLSRASAIATWRGRMVNEHVSSRVFSALAGQLDRAGLVGEVRRVERMIAEERRHGALCAAVVEALGGDARAEVPPLPAVPEHPDADPLEAAVRNILSISCLSETVAVALIDAERRSAGPPELAALLAEILADEVQHARTGWRLLAELAPRFDLELRERLGDWLVLAFGHLVEHELAHLPARPSPSPAAEAVGVCDGNAARALFFATVEQVIVPGLRAHGLDGVGAWQAARHLA
ncbi:MAG: ferritin-like domain-containing protein [Myxococcales bacterium]|nr:ferritin-like domain-containing protein [Myxococcales bacterium]